MPNIRDKFFNQSKKAVLKAQNQQTKAAEKFEKKKARQADNFKPKEKPDNKQTEQEILRAKEKK